MYHTSVCDVVMPSKRYSYNRCVSCSGGKKSVLRGEYMVLSAMFRFERDLWSFDKIVNSFQICP